MKQLACEMCGSTELVKDNGYFVCQKCGTKYSVEEAKKLMGETPAATLNQYQKQGSVKKSRKKKSGDCCCDGCDCCDDVDCCCIDCTCDCNICDIMDCDCCGCI